MMDQYEVEFRVVYRVRVNAASAKAAEQAILDSHASSSHGGECDVISAVRVDLLNDVFKPAHEPPEPPTPPHRGKPTPGGGSPAGGVARVPVLPDCVARAA